MAWSGFGQTHLVQKQAGVQESSGSVSGRTQPARYQSPTFRLGSILPQSRWETRTDPIWFWLTACVRFGPNGFCPEASCVQESSGLLLAMLPSRSGSDPACLLE